jgi:hypothetical protein
MNIFYIHTDPKLCAEWAVDSHCVKMILEAAQLLSTAHRVLDGTEYTDKTASGRNVKRWRLPDQRDGILYSATHINHPSAVWVRQSNDNYNWLWRYLEEHCVEYTYRYGKVHKVESSGLHESLISAPHNIPNAPFIQPPSCMDTKYIISENAVTNYRNYYKVGKAHLHKWKNREAPEWIKEA